MAVIGGVLASGKRRWQPFWMIFYFCFANAAVMAGFWRYLTGRQDILWKKVR
jgi:hypothetical protein